METLRIVGLVVGGIILLGVLVTMGVWVPKVLYRSPEPGKLDGLTVKFTDARVSEDRVIDRTWAVSVYMQNEGSRPREIPRMAYDTAFWSNRRTGVTRARTEYKGHLEHDFQYEVVQGNGVVANRVLNPGDTPAVFTAYVTMPGDQYPEALDIASFDGSQAVKHLRGRLQVSADA